MFQILALEIDGPVIRGAVLARAGFKKVRISRWERFARLEEEGALLSADELAMVTSKLTPCPRDCVVVTPGAAFLRVALPEAESLPGQTGRARKKRGRRLTAALRQETEAYTGMPAAETLLGFARLPEEEGTFWVTAYPLEEYRQLKEVLEEKGLRLKRVYPPDCCFAVAAACFAAKGGSDARLVLDAGPRWSRWAAALSWRGPDAHLVLDAGPEAVRLARIERGRLHSYRTAPLFAPAPFAEFAREDWERLLAELGLEKEKSAHVWEGRPEGEPPALMVTGAGSLEESVPVFLKSFFDGEVTPLVMPAGEPAGTGVCGGDYASVVGAGLRELLYPYISGRALGVSDRPPFLQALAQKAYLAPVAVLLLSFVVLGGHYFLIMRHIAAAEAEFAVLAREREEVRAAVARMQEDENKVTALTEERRLLTDKVDYLQNRLPEYGRLLYAVLSAMDAEADMAIKFVQIELLEQGREFIVSGESADSSSIHRLAVALQGEKWCAFAKVEEIVREVREEETAPEEELGFADEMAGPPPPEAGLLPGEELPGFETGVGPELGGELPADVPGAEGEAFAEGMTTVVFKFKTRVVVLPEFFPERPWPEDTTAQPVTGGAEEGRTP